VPDVTCHMPERIVEPPSSSMAMMPSRNTYDQPRDIKGHRMFVDALQAMPPDFEADLVAET
jgi:hypothetical protein